MNNTAKWVPLIYSYSIMKLGLITPGVRIRHFSRTHHHIRIVLHVVVGGCLFMGLPSSYHGCGHDFRRHGTKLPPHLRIRGGGGWGGGRRVSYRYLDPTIWPFLTGSPTVAELLNVLPPSILEVGMRVYSMTDSVVINEGDAVRLSVG